VGKAVQSGSDFTTAASTSVSVSPGKQNRPVSNSNRMTPNAQMSARLLRAHIISGTENYTRLGHSLIARGRLRRIDALHCARQSFGQAEVQNLCCSLGCDLDVGRLQVAVNRSLPMRRIQPLDNLAADVQRFIDRQRPPATRCARVSPSTSSMT
jgi:hypothetical protein